MEYALIFFIQFFGIGFHIGQKVLEFDKLLPDDSLGDVWRMFWKADKISVLISFFLILPSTEVLYFVLLNYAPKTMVEWEYFALSYFGFALVLGYSGQRIIYNALGKASDMVEKKIADKLN